MHYITQKNIADALGVTRITVSKALSDCPDISVEMRKKVKRVAQEMGYIPDITARNLHRKKTNTIGVVVPDIANSFFSCAIDGMMDAAATHGYHVMLTVSRENAAIEAENIITLLAHRVDGLLVAVSKETTDTAVYKKVKKRNVPLVFFDRTIQGIGFSSVGIDDRSAASTLVAYAIGCGYTKIAHLAGNLSISTGRERHAGYVETLKKFKLPVDEAWIVCGGFDKLSGYKGCRKLLESGRRPEVIFAANDRIAQGAYDALKEAGVKVPDDIGVIALGHSEFAAMLSPTLTIIDSSPEVLGYKAMEVLIEELKGGVPGGVREMTLETILRVNDSLLPRL